LHVAQDGFDLHLLANLNPPGHYDIQFIHLLRMAFSASRERRCS
jgi:hypothetical protein